MIRPKKVPRINYFYKFDDDIFNESKEERPKTLKQIFPFSNKLFKEKSVKNVTENKNYKIILWHYQL